MFKNLLLTIGLVLTTSLLVFSQSGTLKGTLVDSETKEPIPFANIIIEVGGAMKGGASTDFDGNYTIKPITPGSYTIKATYVGYNTKQINGVIIKADQITFLNVDMVSSMTQLDVIEIVDYEVPLISKDQTTSGGTATAEEIAKMPNKTAGAIATTVGGVQAADGGDGEISIRGQRSSGTVMYIDGMRVSGSSALPESAIDQVSVILGGVPAQYGDATGGIISVTTKGPSRKFGAGLELQTSQFLDAFGYNRASVNMNGPLIKSRKNDNVALLGYFLAGEVIYNEDNRPTATGVYKLNDADLQTLRENPLYVMDNGGITYAANYIHKDQLEHMSSALNNDRLQVNLSGKLDIKTAPTMNLSIGGSYNRNVYSPFDYSNTLFNYDATSLTTQNTYRVFGRFSHRFESNPESKALVKNVFYSIQASYQHYDAKTVNPEHGEEIFDYGYLGKFDTYKARNYTEAEASELIENGDTTTIYTQYMDSWQDTLYTFNASDLNPYRANYTENFYRIADDRGQTVTSRNEVISGSGLTNGDYPGGIIGLWRNVGLTQGGYSFYSQDQLDFNIKASMDIGNHELQFGFIYEQRTSRGYSYSANGLYTLMRTLVNTHIGELDTENVASEVWINDSTRQVNYNRLYDGESQAIFDKKLRERMGLAENGTEWIDIESYDRSANTISYIDDEGVRHTTQIDGGLSVDMFTPEELLTQGSGYASAYGFDLYGNKLDSKVTMEDFINGTTTETINGSEVTYNSMLQDAVRPVYMAGYIQDKFAFRDLIFNVGVRVDRFDANHPVLNDPYLLYEAFTAGETADDFTHPTNIGDDYVVYVDDMLSSDKVVTGYRNGNTWYAADGTEITGDPATLLDKGNGVQPYLVEANDPQLSENAFGDYKPQINIMPRIAFSFPISDEALFFAHYDVLTQRPTANWTFDPTSYFFWPIRGVDQINNPDLKPEKTIDYEIGFQQKLSNTSSLKIAAFYREVRDQIQAYRFTEAYPKTYYGYSNIDFGTIKGLTITYDLRRTNNIRLKAAYTLQFAKGTGSDANTQLNLIKAGLPNLRTLLPTANDQRHAFNVNFDYRYGRGKKYDGPSTTRKLADGTTKNVNWLENTGLNITFWGGSGTPYTKYTGTGSRAVIDGSPYGARLPYTYRFDGRLDRDFFIGSDKEGGRSTYLNVYVQVLNLFNTKNILGVYGSTGVADDDGYLADDTWTSIINSYVDPVAFRDLYSTYRESYWNYSSPRQIRVGMSLNF